jgi:hypothetical protein
LFGLRQLAQCYTSTGRNRWVVLFGFFGVGRITTFYYIEFDAHSFLLKALKKGGFSGGYIIPLLTPFDGKIIAKDFFAKN